jgi:hypothetical protein
VYIYGAAVSFLQTGLGRNTDYMTKLFLPFFIILLISCNPSNSWKCINGNCENGYGERLWEDGGYEKGFWAGGKLFGPGNQFFGTTSKFSGDTYSGQFISNDYFGSGTYYQRSADTEYAGEWKDGKPDGKGIITFGEKSEFPGKYYDGLWKEGEKNGYGIMFFGRTGKFANCKYTGEWKDNEMNGAGKFEWAEGNYYEGPWKNNEQEGYGVYVFKNKEVFRGFWKGGVCDELIKKMGKENYLKLY